MQTYKVVVNEQTAVTYLVEAESPEQAEEIYYGNEVGKIEKLREDGIEYTVEDVFLDDTEVVPA